MEAGAFLLFALIQLPCLLNSNLGLKYFLIKMKPEPPPVGQQTKSTERLGVCLMEGLSLPQELVSQLWKHSAPYGIAQQWESLFI